MKFSKLFYIVSVSLSVLIFLFFYYTLIPSAFKNDLEKQETKIYFADNISQAHQKVINKFNEKYKGQIHVEAVDLPFDKFSTNERKELFARYFRSKSDRIDVFAVDQIWVPRFAKWGINLGNFISEEQKKNILSYAMESCIYKDTLVAVPLYIDVSLMYFRRDLVEEIGGNELVEKIKNSVTWEELINLHEKVKNDSNPFFIFQADDFEGLMCIYSEILANFNTSLIENDTLNLNSPAALKSLQFLSDIVNRYKLSPREVTNFKENVSYDYFVQKDGLFLRGWPSFINNYEKTEYHQKLLDNIEMAPTPYFSGFNQKSVFGGWNLIVSQYSTKKQEAVIFIKFLLSEEAQRIMFEEGGYLPVANSIYNDEIYLSNHPELKFYLKLLRNGSFRPFSERYTNISDLLSFYLNKAIKNEISAEEALIKASERISSEGILLK